MRTSILALFAAALPGAAAAFAPGASLRVQATPTHAAAPLQLARVAPEGLTMQYGNRGGGYGGMNQGGGYGGGYGTGGGYGMNGRSPYGSEAGVNRQGTGGSAYRRSMYEAAASDRYNPGRYQSEASVNRDGLGGPSGRLSRYDPPMADTVRQSRYPSEQLVNRNGQLGGPSGRPSV